MASRDVSGGTKKPPQAVFAGYIDLANRAARSSQVISGCWISTGAPDLGSVFRTPIRNAGRKIWAERRSTACEPDQRNWNHFNPETIFVRSYAIFEPPADCTHFGIVGAIQPPGLLGLISPNQMVNLQDQADSLKRALIK